MTTSVATVAQSVEGTTSITTSGPVQVTANAAAKGSSVRGMGMGMLIAAVGAVFIL
jgi:hypothetical protein